MWRIEPWISPPLRSGSFISTPRPEQNRAGSRLTSRTCSYAAIVHEPGSYS